MKSTKNYYGSLCTEMYEILHEKAPQDELNFYLSYAEKGKKILEPLCELLQVVRTVQKAPW